MDTRMIRMVAPTTNILKKSARRSTTNIFPKRVPVTPAMSNQARIASVAPSPAMQR
jgi:hypothetical protein